MDLMSSILGGMSGGNSASKDISVNDYIKKGLESGEVTVRDPETNTVIKVSHPVAKGGARKDGSLGVTPSENNLPGNIGNLVSQVTGGGTQPGKGHELLELLAALKSATSGGRGEMGVDMLGDSNAQNPDLMTLIQLAIKNSQGGATNPDFMGMPQASLPPGTSSGPMGLMGDPMGGGMPPPPPGGGMPPDGGMPPELMAMLGGGGAPPIPGRAGGGPVSPGQPYMVGEQGPETMIPGGKGLMDGPGSLPPQLIMMLAQLLGGGAPNVPGRAGGGPVSPGQPYMVGEQGPETMIPGGNTGMSKSMIDLLFSGVPGRAGGGPVNPDEPYVVGEQGPEVMIPDQAGTIIPNPDSDVTGASGMDAQVESIIDQVVQILEERGQSLLGPDGKMSVEALNVFMEVIQGIAASQGGTLDPMAEEMGGGPVVNPGDDPIVGNMMSGVGGSNDAPMLDALGGGAMSPDMTGETPSGPDDIQALLAALGG